MIFRIYRTSGVSENESIIDTHPILLKYGYRGEHTYKWYGIAGWIEIKSLDELIALNKALDIELIISTDGDDPTIEIYDDFRE